ncbi:MAG: type II secretion system F family protein [Thermoguttaceae bacterium]
MNTSVIGLVVFFALASACGAVILAVRDICVRLGRRKRDGAPAPIRLRRLPRTASDDAARGPVEGFDRWFLLLIKEAGMAITATEAALLLVFCGVVVGSAMFVWNEHPVSALVGLLIGMTAALGYYMIRRTGRIRLLQDQLPTALDMLARGMQAGQSLDQAVELVGRRSPDPLAGEFRFCAKQLDMGLPLTVVMRSLVDRVRLFDVRIFTATLSVHRETGGNVAKVLERLAAVARDRLAYRRQLRAMTGAGRLSAMLIGAIGPLLFLYMFFFQPDYIRTMLESPLGQSLLIFSIVLETVGLIWTVRLLKPTY